MARVCCFLQSAMAVMELPLTLMPSRCHLPSANLEPNLTRCFLADDFPWYVNLSLLAIFSVNTSSPSAL
ncbi:MAG: hypothetical protein CMJ88_11335 [Planctomycetes bacterium]|nr:hypothetical protein [Planctomycetota bacterium]